MAVGADLEAHRHHVEERVFELDTEPFEILPDMEMDFVDAVLELVFVQQRLIHPAVGIGIAFGNMVRMVTMHEQQIQPHAARRLAMHGIEHVCRQAS